MAEMKFEEDDEGRKKLWGKVEEGEWQELESEPLSEDPEVEAMGSIDVDEFERIVEDENHPEHSLAKEYSKIAGEQLRKTMTPFFNDIGKQYSSIFKDIIGPETRSVPSIGLDAAKIVPDVSTGASSRINFPDPPDFEPVHNPTYDVLEEQRALNAQILETNTHLAAMVRQAKEDAAQQQDLLKQQISDARESAGEQRKIAEREHKRGNKALVAAWVAVGVTVVVGFFQIILA